MTNYREKIIELIRSMPLDEALNSKIRMVEEVEYHEGWEIHTITVYPLFNTKFAEAYQVDKHGIERFDINEVYARLWGNIQEHIHYYSKGKKPPRVLAAERYMNNIVTNNADSRGEYIH